MSRRILAVCDRTKNAHVLSRVGVKDGQVVLEFSIGLPARTKRIDSPRASIQAHEWLSVPIDSEDLDFSGVTAYCGSCRKEYFLRFPDVMTVYRSNSSALVLRHAK